MAVALGFRVTIANPFSERDKGFVARWALARGFCAYIYCPVSITAYS
jgi:hypothetical protein